MKAPSFVLGVLAGAAIGRPVWRHAQRIALGFRPPEVGCPIPAATSVSPPGPLRVAGMGTPYEETRS